MMKNVFIETNAQKVLYFMAEHTHYEFTASQIRSGAKLSKSGVHYALQTLIAAGLISKQRKANFFLYSINNKDYLVKQFKVLKTLSALRKIIAALSPLCEEIILFGSASTGENTQESDIDLFAVSNTPAQELFNLLTNKKGGRRVQLIVKTTVSLIDMKAKDPEFYEQVHRGIVLWRKE